MIDTLPGSATEALDWGLEQYQPYFDALTAPELTEENVNSWLQDWSEVLKFVSEVRSRLYVATTIDTTDAQARTRFQDFNGNVFPTMMMTNNTLKQKLLQSGLKPDNFEIPLRQMRVEAELFREENLPLKTQEENLRLQYDQIVGAQTVQWEGEEVTLTRLVPVAQDQDRARREQAWRLTLQRRLQDRPAFNALWGQLLALRQQIARNAGLPDYRTYQWRELGRLDYSPEDSLQFHDSIEKVVVPALARRYEKLKAALGVETLRPWDVGAGDGRSACPDPQGRPALKPYDTVEALESGLENIFRRVAPQFGDYFSTLRQEKLLDLENRKGKAPGGYMISYSMTGKPFIFMNAVGIHDDVQTLLHEGGHAFHTFESLKLPYIHQAEYPAEFAEVASMAMELLGAPYLAAAQGGFYTEEEAARARMEHLEGILIFWPYMAVVDAFQHWVYTHSQDAADPANCDAKWGELWDRFIPVVDYTGLEDVKVTGWHRKLHIFHYPFYYVEYGLAQLGSVQIWANSLKDQAKATEQYLQGLRLGGTRKLPELYAAAGAKLAFDAQTLGEAVTLLEQTLEELEAV